MYYLAHVLHFIKKYWCIKVHTFCLCWLLGYAVLGHRKCKMTWVCHFCIMDTFAAVNVPCAPYKLLLSVVKPKCNDTPTLWKWVVFLGKMIDISSQGGGRWSSRKKNHPVRASHLKTTQPLQGDYFLPNQSQPGPNTGTVKTENCSNHPHHNLIKIKLWFCPLPHRFFCVHSGERYAHQEEWVCN